SQSKYRTLLPLFVGRNIVLVSPEAKAKEMLRVLRSVPQINLCSLGACIDDTILSRKGVEDFAKLPSLEAAQGQTLGALALLPSQTSALLQRGPLLLAALLHRLLGLWLGLRPGAAAREAKRLRWHHRALPERGSGAGKRPPRASASRLGKWEERGGRKEMPCPEGGRILP
ncbi:PREDICTED: 39S ribosomal protein L10, mitochondrial, partial [Tinamus guttatus]|uniref:39S ribosomal protein L10, mitochondrial n=1 Tax=Tinamus guttatus TaxID=94827 RepID=UPI00052E6ED0